jgi:hypothetical protein
MLVKIERKKKNVPTFTTCTGTDVYKEKVSSIFPNVETAIGNIGSF